VRPYREFTGVVTGGQAQGAAAWAAADVRLDDWEAVIP